MNKSSAPSLTQALHEVMVEFETTMLAEQKKGAEISKKNQSIHQSRGVFIRCFFTLPHLLCLFPHL